MWKTVLAYILIWLSLFAMGYWIGGTNSGHQCQGKTCNVRAQK